MTRHCVAVKAHVHERCRPPRTGGQQCIAPVHLVVRYAAQIDGDARRAVYLISRLPEALQRAHADTPARQFERVAASDGAATERSGHHGTAALDGE